MKDLIKDIRNIFFQQQRPSYFVDTKSQISLNSFFSDDFVSISKENCSQRVLETIQSERDIDTRKTSCWKILNMRSQGCDQHKWKFIHLFCIVVEAYILETDI